MPPRRAATGDNDQSFATTEARVRSASQTARSRLAALVAATRRVLAALSADPSAVETGARVEVDDDEDDDSKMMVDDEEDRKTKPLVRALSESVEDLLAARAALRASVKELKAAESLSASVPQPARDAEAAGLAAAAKELEPRVAALRDRVAAKNSAVAAMADSLAALVSDVDSWRVAGPGAWPESEAGGAGGEAEE